MHDIIGDIHENYKQLWLLPGKPGCYCQSEAYRHPERQAVFLGDYIDRKIGEIRENEGLYVGEQAVGEFRDNGNVYSQARRIDRTNHTRRICSGSQLVRELNPTAGYIEEEESSMRFQIRNQFINRDAESES